MFVFLRYIKLTARSISKLKKPDFCEMVRKSDVSPRISDAHEIASQGAMMAFSDSEITWCKRECVTYLADFY